MFFPREIQVWFDASSLALGGKLVKNMPIANLYADTDALYQFLGSLSVFDLNKTIIVFTGKWDFDGIELCGYLSVQNQEDRRKTYGDISISAYAKKEFEDLVDGS